MLIDLVLWQWISFVISFRLSNKNNYREFLAQFDELKVNRARNLGNFICSTTENEMDKKRKYITKIKTNSESNYKCVWDKKRKLKSMHINLVMHWNVLEKIYVKIFYYNKTTCSHACFRFEWEKRWWLFRKTTTSI